ncbi:hypothetical protein SAMN04488700_0913 [Carnobacterium iners]|uniref:Uncharacterized protein n=2 Tax=Carnobacterium iners TaxID=1073423 RepID=A0A1X7MUU2_9LACT|nr:hypothetical protein SAMN04488114_1215 [Carnobacterium iners]SMH28451.1 hypothetical protein SAMN04488700_0913 [Carnobacterium iners]
MINMTRLISKQEDSKCAMEWETNITDLIVEILELISVKINQPIDIIVKTPWEHDPDGF